jgi:hypothetical protein
MMAKLIAFYVPGNFKCKRKWLPPDQRGRLLTFPVENKKSA